MSELDAIALGDESEVIEEQQHAENVTKINEPAAESAPAEAETSAEVDKTAELQKTLAEKAYKEREARRRANELEKRLEELEAKQNQPVFDGTVPPLPDQYDDDYEVKVKAHVDALNRKAQADAYQNHLREQQAQEQRKREREEIERNQKRNAEFTQNAQALGIDQQKLAQAAQTVVNYGITSDIEDAIMNDKDGALVLMHLASNPLELSDLIDSDPISKGMILAEVKSKAQSLKPKTSSAPPPPTTLSGRGAPPAQRGPKGATFE